MIIFFDIDDTLLDHKSAVKQSAILFRPYFSSLLTLDQEEFQKLWSSLIDQAFSLYASGTMSLKDARRWRMKELFAALGELVTEKAGVLNMGVEGMMLTGAFFGFYGAYETGSLWIGVAAGSRRAG